MQSAYDVYMYNIGQSNGYPVYQNIFMLAYMGSLLVLFGNFYGKDRQRELQSVKVDESVDFGKRKTL